MAVKGNFQDISFVELLQLIDVGRKTGRIEITCEEKWAMVIFQEGTVWHVEPRGFRGASPEEVIFDLIGTEDGKFVFQRLQLLPSLERTVNMSTKALIMEGIKRTDDRKVLAVEETAGGEGGGESQLDQCLRLKPDAEAKVRYVPQSVKRVLALIDGQRTASDIISKSQMDANQAAQIIKDLISQDVIELFTPKAEAAEVAELKVSVGE